MRYIDLNSDLGEGFGPYRIAEDEALLDIVSSANVACGGHAGDPCVMDETVRSAMARGVVVGAHIGYPDREGFGRRAMSMSHRELELMTIAQLGALRAIAEHAGARLTHANFHGALGNLSFVDEDVARTLIGAVRAFDRDLVFVGLPHTKAALEAERQGLRLVRSFLADRGYTPAGLLAPRSTEGALVKDLGKVRERVARVLAEGEVEAIDGSRLRLEADSILVHSDTPGALALARTIAEAVAAASCEVRSFAS
jgi:5-oxoprolinase (ATP-hydrolysing) subunit A